MKKKGFDLPSDQLVAVDSRIRRAYREGKNKSLQASNAAGRNLPATLSEAKAVLWDKSKSYPSLLYIYDDPSGKLGKVAVRIDAKRAGETVNAAGYHMQVGKVEPLAQTLQDTNKYELIKGGFK